METYTSPSGHRYEIHPRVYTRAAGGILEGCDLYDIEETTSNAEEGVEEAIAHFENPGSDLGSRFD